MVTVWYFALSWFKSFKDNKELYNCLSWNDLIEILFSSSHKSLVDFIEVRLTGLLREVKRINKHGYVLLSIVWDILLIKCLPHYWSSKMLTKKKRPTTTCTAQVWFKIWKKKKQHKLPRTNALQIWYLVLHSTRAYLGTCLILSLHLIHFISL